MKQLFHVLTLTLSLTATGAAFSSSAFATTYSVVSVSTDPGFTGTLTKTDTVVQAGADSRNRFVMHRITNSSPSFVRKGIVLLLPSLLLNFKEYTVDAAGNKMNSLVAQLAQSHYEVWGYSPRTAMTGSLDCTLGVVDCSIMSTWGFGAYLDDIDYIRDQMAIARPGENPVVGGLSLGGILGYGTINRRPADYAGLWAYESTIYSANSTIRTLNTANCAVDQAQIAAGVPYTEALPQAAKIATALSELASVQVFGTPNPVFGTPTFLTQVPNFLRTAYQYVHFPRFQQFLIDANFVESWAILRDYHCSVAGDRTFSANLSAFTGPVLAIAAGQAIGANMLDSIALLGTSSSNVTYRLDSAFGHADAYLTASHSTYIDTPLLNWLAVVFP